MRLFVLQLLLFLSIQTVWAETLEGRVVSVHDGDTITLLMPGNKQVKIRLAQIDAPESAQAFGQKSKQSLSEMVFSKTVKVEKETIDKYGRTVGTVFVDGLDANREQVKQGMAWAYRQYLHDQSLVQDEDIARQSKVGLWSDPNLVPPWEYRHAGKKAKLANINAKETEQPKSTFDGACGSKRYCKQMSSCGEAMFYLSQCGLNRLDGDGDGVPCEALCGKK